MSTCPYSMYCWRNVIVSRRWNSGRNSGNVAQILRPEPARTGVRNPLSHHSATLCSSTRATRYITNQALHLSTSILLTLVKDMSRMSALIPDDGFCDVSAYLSRLLILKDPISTPPRLQNCHTRPKYSSYDYCGKSESLDAICTGTIPDVHPACAAEASARRDVILQRKTTVGQASTQIKPLVKLPLQDARATDGWTTLPHDAWKH